MPVFLGDISASGLSQDGNLSVSEFLKKERKKREEEKKRREDAERLSKGKDEKLILAREELAIREEEIKKERKPFGKQSVARYIVPETFNILTAVGQTAIDLVESAGQGFLRNIASGVLTVSGVLGGTREVELDPDLKANELLFGESNVPLKAIETRLAEGDWSIKDYGNAIKKGDVLTFLKDNQAEILGEAIISSTKPESPIFGLTPSAFVAGAFIFADFTPLGGILKGSKLLAKIDDVVKVTKELKKTGMADDVIKVVAPKIAREKTPKGVDVILKRAKRDVPTEVLAPDGSVMKAPETQQIDFVPPGQVEAEVAQKAEKLLKKGPISKEGAKEIQETLRDNVISKLKALESDDFLQGKKGQFDPETIGDVERIIKLTEKGKDKIADIQEGAQILKRLGVEDVSVKAVEVKVTAKDLVKKAAPRKKGVELVTSKAKDIQKSLTEIKAEKAGLKASLEATPGKELSQFVAKSGEFKGQLPEILGKDVKGLGSVKAKEFALRGDEIIDELGVASRQEAQKIVDDFVKLKGQIREVVSKEADITKQRQRVAGVLGRTGRLLGKEEKIIQKIQSELKVGGIVTKKQVKGIQNELIEVAEAMKREFGIEPISLRNIKNIQTPEQLADILPEIAIRANRLSEAKEIRTLKTSIAKEMKKAKPKIGGKKALESKFGPEAQKNLDFLRGATSEGKTDGAVKAGKGLHIKGDRARAINEIEDNINKYGIAQDGVMLDVPLEVAERNALLNMVGVQDMSAKELRSTLANLKSLKETGEFKVLLKQANKSSKIERIIDIARAEFKSKKDKVKVVGEVALELGPVRKVLEIMDNGLLGIRNIAEKITFSKEFKVADWLGETIRLARNNHNRLGPKWNNAKVKKFKEIFGEKGLRKTYQKLNKEKTVFNGKDRLGNSVKMKLSEFEAAYWWGQTQDPTRVAGFIKKMNFTPEMFKALDSSVSPKMKEYTRFLIDDWLKNIRKLSNPRYQAKFGMDMPDNPNYLPYISADIKQEDITNLLIGEAFPGFASTVPSAVKARTGAITAIKRISIEDVMRRHAEQMNQFINFDEVVSDARRVFLNPEVKETILQSSGKSIYSTLIKKIDDIARGGMAAQIQLAGLDRFIANFTKSTMVFNFAPFLKQITSFPAFTIGRGSVTYPELISGATAYYSNPVKWTKMLVESDFIFGRLTKGFDRETALAFRQGKKNFTIKETGATLGDFLRKAAITPTRGGDMVPILPGMTAKYLQATKQLQKQGKLTTKQIHKKALGAAEQLASRTQQSPHIEDLGRIQTANSLGKSISMYGTTPIQYMRESIASVRMWNRGQMSTKDMVRGVVTSWIILPQLFQYVSDGFVWNSERQSRALLLGPINYYPAAGNMLGTMYDAIVKGEDWKDVGSSISPLFSVPVNQQKAAVILHKILTEGGSIEEWGKFAEKQYNAIALTAGLPSSGPVRNVKGVIDLTKGDTKDPRRLIFSAFALEEGDPIFLPAKEREVVSAKKQTKKRKRKEEKILDDLEDLTRQEASAELDRRVESGELTDTRADAIADKFINKIVAETSEELEGLSGKEQQQALSDKVDSGEISDSIAEDIASDLLMTPAERSAKKLEIPERSEWVIDRLKEAGNPGEVFDKFELVGIITPSVDAFLLENFEEELSNL